MNRSEAGKLGYEKSKNQLNTYHKNRREKLIDDYESNPKHCPTCEAKIPFEKRRNKFCSKSCSATHNNKGVVRVKTTHPKTCTHCGEIKETRQNKYCDTCIEAHIYNIPQSVEGLISQEGVRAYLLRTRAYKCENCDRETWLGQPIPLEAHHVDGNPDNNAEENLQLLCRNCHTLTENYGGAGKNNEGRFSRRRKKRRKRYRQGKSW